MADVLSQLSQLSTWLEELAVQYGLAGVFTASLLGSLIPFLPVPYLFVVVLLSDTMEPWTLGLAAGLGGSLGKVTSYLLGRSGYRLLSLQGRRKMDVIRSLIGRYGDIGIFIFAITPLPDDVYLIPVGMMRFHFWRFLLANTLGKIALASIVAYLGRAYFSLARMLIGDVGYVSVGAAMAAMIALTILMLRVDWELAVRIMREGGWRGVIRNISLILSLGRNRK